MLRELEQRLADVLGDGLPAPLAGAVAVAPGGSASQVLVSIRRAEPAPGDFLSSRPERVPGADGSRRVLRLRCDVALDVRQRQGQTRDDQMSAFDTLVYFLDAPGIRSGRALDGGAADPGFFLHGLTIRTSDPPVTVGLDAEGLFWPVGLAGETGDPIARIRTRMVIEPLLFDPPLPRVVAGGPAIDLSIRVGAGGAAMDVLADGVEGRPFGDAILRVTDAGGRPGAGVLSGGAAGPNGSRRVPFAGGTLTFRYTPPAEAVIDMLHVSFDDGAGTMRQEIGRLPIAVRGV
jgi:hypothetical protein